MPPVTLTRQRLPNRRAAETQDIQVGTRTYKVTVGFDPSGRPKEIFLAGAHTGSEMAAILADTAVALSVALQHDVKAEAMSRSMSRVPDRVDGPPVRPATVLGAALDLLVRYETCHST